MAVVQDLIDEWQGLANARIPWETYWRNIAAYVLPQTESFDTMLSGALDGVITSVVGQPEAAQKSKNIYDMTSLWGIERLTAGLLSLKTPETEHWHNISFASFFEDEQTHDEDLAAERLRNYLFKVRANPQTGFWDAHRAAVKSMCGFGDGWYYIEDTPGGGVKRPFRYLYQPLNQVYPGVSPEGVPNRMYRVFSWSAEQIVKKFGEKAGSKVMSMAQDPKRRHDKVKLMHAVRPRDDFKKLGMGIQTSDFESHYCLPEEKHHIGEGGFYEFPFVRYAWNNSGQRPFSEGPVAYAIGEIKSLQEMAKNELIATQTHIRPAYATYGKNFNRLNLNPGAVNGGLMTRDGKPLFQPLTSGSRPDFAQAVLEQRRESVRELLYLNLWQIVLQDTNDTATEALLRAQEKGELLGPVGISLNAGLSTMVDRETAILARRDAFAPSSPLEMPSAAEGKDIAPIFTSPLDRLRRMGELIGMQRLAEFATMLSGGDPNMAMKIMARFDIDEMLDKAREILGAPVGSLLPQEQSQQQDQMQDGMQQVLAALESVRAGGEAAKAAGEGSAALAQGAEQAAASPALKGMMQGGLPAGGQAGMRAFNQLNR